ncbi:MULTISPECIES: hypothetical protein [unclassified Algibacter]|uniref:hypothetical protein n=1 Tax=unclassified Algibacter TaxID=2615009 RepID=UPI00131E7809|nr:MULTISPECIES: hypothetical protein [unclassified Algibacter]MCL5130263.1 hypothetical protein [Algibacter sp. L4_22]
MNLLFTIVTAQNAIESTNSLISILSIAFITILALLTMNLYKVYQLKKRNAELEAELKALKTETRHLSN